MIVESDVSRANPRFPRFDSVPTAAGVRSNEKSSEWCTRSLEDGAETYLPRYPPDFSAGRAYQPAARSERTDARITEGSRARGTLYLSRPLPQPLLRAREISTFSKMIISSLPPRSYTSSPIDASPSTTQRPPFRILTKDFILYKETETGKKQMK